MKYSPLAFNINISDGKLMKETTQGVTSLTARKQAQGGCCI